MNNNLILYDICYIDFIKISSEIDGIKIGRASKE